MMNSYFKAFICFISLSSLGFGQPGLIDRAVEFEYKAPEKAYLLADSALNQAIFNDDLSLQARAYHTLGNIFYSQGAFLQAMEYYLKSESVYLELKDEKGRADNLLQLGKVHYYIKQEKESYIHLYEALEVYQKLDDQKHIAEIYGELGHLYEKASDYDSALYYQEKALTIYKKINRQEGMAHIYENMGSIYEDLEDHKKAYRFFKKAASINKINGNRVELVSNLNNIGDSYRKTFKEDSALYYTRQALVLADSMDLKYQVSSALRDLAKIYFQLGNLDKAYDYQEKSRDIYEEVYSQESSRQMALLQTLYEVERKNNAIKVLENEKRLERFTRFGLLGATGAILLLGGVMISRQRLKIRQNQELIEQQEKLHHTEIENAKLNEDRLRIELDHKQLQERHLELELETQQKSLAARMLQLIEKNKLLEELKEGLLVMKKELPKDSAKKLKPLVNQINYSFNHDKAWEDFRKSFEQIHQEFFDRLKKVNPELTSNDLRICALMRINLSSKDIALLLGISQDSLRVARYRLRKKLCLDQKENLRKYLLNI